MGAENRSSGRDLGEGKKAVEYIEKGYGIVREVRGDEHPDVQALKEVLEFLKRGK